MIQFVFASQRRSGSTFLINLCKAALYFVGQDFDPYFVFVRPYREREDICEGWRRYKQIPDQKSWLKDYVHAHNVRFLKIEEPGINSFAQLVAETFPQSRWLTSIRNISDIVASHFNIQSWGEPPEIVMKQWEENVIFLEQLQSLETNQPTLLALNIDEPKHISATQFVRFLRIPKHPALDTLFEKWPKANTLSTHQKLKNEPVIRRPLPDHLLHLIETFPQIPSIQKRYEILLSTNQESLATLGQ